MRLLYIARLFTGLESSVRTENWAPTGVPAIYKVINSLDTQVDCLRIVLSKKASIHSGLTLSTDRRLKLSGLRSKVDVLAGEEYFPTLLGSLRPKLSEIRQLFVILLIFWKFRPDVIYIDHANIWAAGVLARISRRPVILRLMGVYPAMRSALRGSRPAHMVLRWCYRAPYSAVICTQDGSGVEPWLRNAISKSVPLHTLLNGVDIVSPSVKSKALQRLPSQRCIVMFLGKIEDAKGAPEFVNAFLDARSMAPGRFHALIVGTGSRLDDLMKRVKEHSAVEDFTFIERLTHEEVSAALARADIYVSLNRLGNLSNANLEAMRAGCCMVIPSSQCDTSVDVITDELIPDDAVFRIPSVDDVAALTKALIDLSEQTAKREVMGKTIKGIADQVLMTWEQRVSVETKLIQSVARAN